MLVGCWEDGAGYVSPCIDVAMEWRHGLRGTMLRLMVEAKSLLVGSRPGMMFVTVLLCSRRDVGRGQSSSEDHLAKGT